MMPDTLPCVGPTLACVGFVDVYEGVGARCFESFQRFGI
jgi:hypothetical protein